MGSKTSKVFGDVSRTSVFFFFQPSYVFSQVDFVLFFHIHKFSGFSPPPPPRNEDIGLGKAEDGRAYPVKTMLKKSRVGVGMVAVPVFLLLL